jgi:hypothetical protein
MFVPPSMVRRKVSRGWVVSSVRPARLAGGDAVNLTEGSPQGFGGAVAVAGGDLEERRVLGDHLGCRQGHATSTYVGRQRHPGESGEHPSEVVGRCQRDARELVDVDLIGQLLLEFRERTVESFDHRAVPFVATTLRGDAGADPMIPARSGQGSSPSVDATPPRGHSRGRRSRCGPG